MTVTPTSSITVYVIEEEIYRYMYQALPADGPVRLVGMADRFEAGAVREALRALKPRVLVAGLANADTAVLHELARIHADFPETGLVAFFGHISAPGALGKIPRGNGGLALFSRRTVTRTKQVIEIIRAVGRGETVVDQHLVSALFPGRKHPALESFSARELEILELLASGYTNTAIAEALFVNVKTVENHLNLMYGKLKASRDLADRHPRLTIATLYLQSMGRLI
ncbi:MAG: response regulator transcription factor [Chloroflexi bacterium]|nr:response regulator transcription factor [Chloroflexota bacterium]